jgi:hypothetical protein
MQPFTKDQGSVYEAITAGSGQALLDIRPEQFLTDNDSLRLLLSATDDRALALKESVAFLYKLGGTPKICFLLDTDFIRKYMAIESAKDHDGILLRYCFEHSTLPYAIPQGSYMEILQYLAHLLRRVRSGGENLTSAITQARQTGPLDGIALLLEVPGQNLRDPACVEELADQAGGQMVRLARLIYILTSARLSPVVHDSCDGATKASLLQTLQNQDRFIWRDGRYELARDRDVNDERDATNLAVAFQGAKSPGLNGDTLGGEGHLILLTTTRAVLEAANEYNGHTLFAASPRQLVIPDCLNFSGNWAGALNRCRALLDKLRDIEGLLLDSISLPGAPEYRDFVETGQREIQAVLRSFQESIQFLVAEGFYRLEATRNPLLAIQRLHARQLQEQHPGRVETPQPMVLNYRKVLDRVAVEVDKLHGMTYSAKQVELSRPRSYSEYEIQAAFDGAHDSSGAITLRRFPGQDSAPEYFSCHWQVECDDQQFLRALDELLPIGPCFPGSQSPGAGSGDTRVVYPIGASSELWRRGVVVSSSVAAYGIEPQHVRSSGSWLCLSLATLNALHSLLPTDVAPKAYAVEIQELRINTDFFDLVFDILPSQIINGRRLAVLSHYNLATTVAALFDRLGTRLVLRNSLATTLNKTLQGFPRWTPS